MIWTYGIDAILVIALSFLVVVIYKLSIREFSLRRGAGNTTEELKGFNSNASKIFPAKMIRFAGFIPEAIAPVYWVIKIVLAALLPLLYLEFFQGEPSYWKALFLGVIGFFSFDLLVYSRAKRRKQQIQNSVSFFVDLLVAFLKAGLTLSEAFERTAAHGLPKDSPLAKEVTLLTAELEVGLPWQLGFEKLATRTGSKDLSRLALMMKIGQNTGAPMLGSLSNYAELLRETQVEKVNALLNRKTLETLIPTLLLSMPVFLVLVFFPTGVQIFEAFQLFSSAW
tara:strand:- start:28055 stop:28900 length:846 start_codon:yes stop_codon:yes gene_type:complete